jgi:phenylacetate-coenzyme A ligase PaaK-like adenylate-forming protein
MISAVARRIYLVQERWQRRPTFDYLNELEQSQWLSRPELEALQTRKLNELLLTALEHSPWHANRIREVGLEQQVCEQSVGLGDLPRLPTMDKRDARQNQNRIVWKGVPGGAFKYTTGGSSGEPLVFYFGRRRQASDAAGRMRARRWWGVEVGGREVYLWGAPVELNKTDRIKTLRDRLINQLVLNAFEMSPHRMDGYLKAISSWQPKCIYGYASSIALLAAHGEARGARLQLPGLKVICTTGEPLYTHQREVIGRFFGAPVANEFGSRDIGFTAHEAPSGPMLLMSESHILEVVDSSGKPVPPGEAGEAVITGFTSEAQPFIRYRTGDMVRLSAQTEPAGRGLHVIQEVIGRETDFVIRDDGTIMHALAVIYVLRAVEGVAQFKCIQHSTLHMEVQIVPGPAWNDLAGLAVINGLKARLGQNVKVTLSMMNDIPPEASGKHRYVVSHVGMERELQQAVAR